MGKGSQESGHRQKNCSSPHTSMWNLTYDKRNAQETSNEIPFFGYEIGKDQKV